MFILKKRGLYRSFVEIQGHLIFFESNFILTPQASSITFPPLSPLLNGESHPETEKEVVEKSDFSVSSRKISTATATATATTSAMCPTELNPRTSAADPAKCSSADTIDWISDLINGGSLRHVDLLTGTNGWASPPGDLFYLRSKNYLTRKQKSPSGDYLLQPIGMDWLRSSTKLENVLARLDNRVSNALRKAHSQGKSLKSFVFAVNLQVPGKDHHSAVFYFATEDPIPPGSLLHRFVNGGDAFRNQRFKIVNRIVKGPWIVKKAVGNYSACLLGKALTCNYHRGHNYLEIDVDISSSTIATAVLHLALGYVTSVTVDMGFLVEAQAEDELPERLIGAVRVCQMEMSSAFVVDSAAARGLGPAKVVNHQKSGDDDGDDIDEKKC